jgi:hypothetical protein
MQWKFCHFPKTGGAKARAQRKPQVWGVSTSFQWDLLFDVSLFSQF